jgi:hypothetical protein
MEAEYTNAIRDEVYPSMPQKSDASKSRTMMWWLASKKPVMPVRTKLQTKGMTARNETENCPGVT